MRKRPRQRSQLHSFQLELCRPRMLVRTNTWHRLSNYCLRASSSSCRSPRWPRRDGSGLRVENARPRGDNAGPPADDATPRAGDATLAVHYDERAKRSPPSGSRCGASALPYGNVTTLLLYSERSSRTSVNEKRCCWLPAHLPSLPELLLLTQLVLRSELAWTQSSCFWREPARPYASFPAARSVFAAAVVSATFGPCLLSNVFTVAAFGFPLLFLARKPGIVPCRGEA